jgi:hypothetical protein
MHREACFSKWHSDCTRMSYVKHTWLPPRSWLLQPWLPEGDATASLPALRIAPVPDPPPSSCFWKVLGSCACSMDHECMTPCPA